VSGATDVDQAAVDSLRWYHTIELPGGVVTAGEFDLRPIVGRLPWPESLAGKRCLDVGGRDGFYGFEMERRGAEEVVSIDVGDPDDIQLPADFAPGRERIQQELDDGNRAFEMASGALGSKVRRELVSVHRLDPARHGSFDFGVIGTLLLHLRDPVGALGAIRGVIRGQFLMNEAVIAGLDLLSRRPVAEPVMSGPFWWIGNPAALRRMAEAAGFRVVESGRPYLIPRGSGSRTTGLPEGLRRSLRRPLRDFSRRLVNERGMLHAYVLLAAD
jgi:tRNA (mo5U34)-methyltransferase